MHVQVDDSKLHNHEQISWQDGIMIHHNRDHLSNSNSDMADGSESWSLIWGRAAVRRYSGTAWQRGYQCGELKPGCGPEGAEGMNHGSCQTRGPVKHGSLHGIVVETRLVICIFRFLPGCGQKVQWNCVAAWLPMRWAEAGLRSRRYSCGNHGSCQTSGPVKHWSLHGIVVETTAGNLYFQVSSGLRSEGTVELRGSLATNEVSRKASSTCYNTWCLGATGMWWLHQKWGL